MPHSEAVTSWVILAALRLSRIASPRRRDPVLSWPVYSECVLPS